MLEIFVDCPIEECEKRDVKGHYRRARQGEIPHFTGVSSPYESPENPEIWLKSDRESVYECIKIIVNYLNKKNDLNVIIAKVFSISESEVNDQSGPENIERWDSFNGLVLIDELESHFNVQFSVSEITDVETVADIKRHLKNHNVVLDD